MSFSFLLKSGFRYGLSYIVVSVCCTILIVIGNDLLFHSAYREHLCDPILEISYAQWLPVSALALASSFLAYLLLYRICRRLPLWCLGLLCGSISVIIVLVSGIASFPYWSWYEFKNMLSFFIAGFALPVFAELIG